MYIGNRREVLWDNTLINEEKSTAVLKLHRPEKKELMFTFDRFREPLHVSYPHCIFWNSQYYMYYISGVNVSDGVHLTAHVLTSEDFKNWNRPDAGICEYNGNTDNNIILMEHVDGNIKLNCDNMFVFVDENPGCPDDEKIKATLMCSDVTKSFPEDRELWLYASGDGIHFEKKFRMMSGADENGGIFDSLNIMWFDSEESVYKAYVRGLHEGIRDVRYVESKDLKTWTVPKLISFGDGKDIPLYTNQVQRYFRAPHMYIGMPTRYVERTAWTPNFEQLGGTENVRRRKQIIKDSEPRSGLAVTDCVFMSSRDGLVWNRFDEMFMGPGLEHRRNWYYGDSSYPMYNILETPCEAPSEATELSLFMHEGHRTGEGAFLYRYALRLDGFASYHSDFKESVLTTKTVVFDGKTMHINFETSAIGYVYVDILDKDGTVLAESCELFGNTTDRIVYFGDTSDVSAFAGKEIVLRFRMSDADLYSFVFEK